MCENIHIQEAGSWNLQCYVMLHVGVFLCRDQELGGVSAGVWQLLLGAFVNFGQSQLAVSCLYGALYEATVSNSSVIFPVQIREWYRKQMSIFQQMFCFHGPLTGRSHVSVLIVCPLTVLKGNKVWAPLNFTTEGTVIGVSDGVCCLQDLIAPSSGLASAQPVWPVWVKAGGPAQILPQGALWDRGQQRVH